MKKFIPPGGFSGQGTHGGPRFGKGRPGFAPQSPPQATTPPRNTPLSINEAANAEFSRGNISAGIALLEEAVFKAAQASKEDPGSQLLTVRLIMAYEEHNVIANDERDQKITESRQERMFAIVTYAKTVAGELIAKRKKTGSVSMLFSGQLKGKSLEDFQAIAAKQEELILAVTPVPDPPAPPTPTPPVERQPVDPACPAGRQSTGRPAAPVQPAPAGARPTQDNPNSRAAALLTAAERIYAGGNKNGAGALLRRQFAPIAQQVTDPDILSRARTLAENCGERIPELTPPAVQATRASEPPATHPLPVPQPIRVTEAGAAPTSPVEDTAKGTEPTPPLPEPKSVDTETRAQVDLLLRRAAGLVGRDKEQIPLFRQALDLDPGNSAAIEGLNSCARRSLVDAEREFARKNHKAAGTMLGRAVSAQPADPAVKQRMLDLAVSLQGVGITVEGLEVPLQPPPTPFSAVAASDERMGDTVIDREPDIPSAPADPEELRGLVKTLTQKGDFDGAQRALASLQAIEPDSKDTLIIAIIFYSKAGMMQEWINSLVLFLSKDRRNLFVLTQLGFYFLRTEDELHARAVFEHVLRINPDNKSAKNGLHRLRGPRPADLPSIEEAIARAQELAQLPEAETTGPQRERPAQEQRGTSAVTTGLEVQNLCRLAEQAVAEGQQAKALEHFLDARRLDPKSGRVNTGLSFLFGEFRAQALSAREAGHLEEAQEAVRMALDIRPDDAQMLDLRRDIKAEVAARASRAPEPSPHPEAAARPASAPPPKPAAEPPVPAAAPAKEATRRAGRREESPQEKAAKLLDFARQKIAGGETDYALAALRGVLDIDPENAEAKALMAQIEEQQRSPEPPPVRAAAPTPPASPARAVARTLGELRAAVAKDPGNLTLLADLIGELTRQNQLDEALDFLDQALEINPNDANILTRAAVLYGRMQRYEDQLETILILLEIDPDNLVAIGQLGLYFFNQGENEHAHGAFAYVLQKRPGDSMAIKGIEFLNTRKHGAPSTFTEVLAAAKKAAGQEEETPAPVPDQAAAPTPAPAAASTTSVRRRTGRPPKPDKKPKPPLPDDVVQARREEVLAFLAQPGNLNLTSTQLPRKIFRIVYDTRVFPLGLVGAREEAAKKTT